MMTPRLAGSVLAFLTLTLGPAFAEPKACTCENLESIQQDYQNAVYLIGYMERLAAHLEAEEIRLKGLKVSSNTDPDQNLSIVATVGQAREAYEKANLKLPFPAVKDYKGPERVPMPVGSCEQDQGQLDAMRDGSPCEALADAALAHELGHRDLCKKMGAEAYWDRMPSELALEEVEMYKAQAANLKAELRRVLDVSEVKLRGEWRHVLAGSGVEIVYFYEFESGDMSVASEGGDRWTLSGEGETQNVLESMKVPEVSCTSDGVIRNKFTVSMDTDGLTFGLNYSETTNGGNMKVTCKAGKGQGMGMAIPGGGASSGQLATSQPLVAGDNPLPNSWADAIMALAANEGMSVSGEPKTVLSVTCKAP